jgi:hypothetical protein
VPAARVWRETGVVKVSFERYRLIFARYHMSRSSDQSQVAWVIYAAPISSTVPGRGVWIIDVFDSNTGARPDRAAIHPDRDLPARSSPSSDSDRTTANSRRSAPPAIAPAAPQCS